MPVYGRALVALALWSAAVAGVLAGTRGGFAGWDLPLAVLYLPVVLLVAFSLAGACAGSRGAGRLFWGAMCAGFLLYLVGSPLWSPAREPGLPFSTVCHAAGVLLLFGALLLGIFAVSRRAGYVAWADALAVGLSLGVLFSVFVASPAELAADYGWPETLADFCGPVAEAALLYLGLVLAGVDGSPPFARPLALGVLALFAAEFAYLLGVRHSGGGPPALWQHLLWLCGPVLVSLAARRSSALESSPLELGVHPWRQAAFWFGPLSPAVQFAVVFLWTSLHPPVPRFVAFSGAVLALYLAVRISVFAYAVHRLRRQRDGAIGRLEQARISEELHDTVKQNVHAAALLIGSYREVREKEGEEAAERILDEAVAASREASHQVGRSIEEIQARCGEGGELDVVGMLRERLCETREHFAIATREDLRADLSDLGPEERAAAYRVPSEALWNAARHSGARNVWLESRRVGPTFILRIRDDGRGLPEGAVRRGTGFAIMRKRARRAEGELEVISSPGRGTTVQLRFEEG
ncbi:sensor histidine kinase [Rubrobacter calidifluminis]|uniref:sensor histidine kinase n=1 Tax=Rubrobacter calidifluminis TaxID=1392640 RepID=UPI00235DFA4D|nr:ATP-binding protein [Rubrobacter calidifluminis]